MTTLKGREAAEGDMRRYVLSLLLPLFLNCAGKNTVAGLDKTKSEQLSEAVPSWCAGVCRRFTTCDSGDDCSCSDDSCSCANAGGDDCVENCQAAMAAFTTGDDDCATIGQSFKSCIDGSACGDLLNGVACQLTKAEKAACPKPKSHDETVDSPPSMGSGSPGSSMGGSSSTAPPDGTPSVGGGSDSTLPASGPAGSSGSSTGGATGEPVFCSNSYASGGGSPDPTPNGYMLCEEGMSDCSDGHEYSMLCAKNTTGQAACSCLVDSGVTGAFDPGDSCPDLQQMNAGCHFNIAP